MSLSQDDMCLSCPGAVELGVLLPHLAGVVVEGVVAAAGLLLVLARARPGTASCPACGTVSARVHSRYARRLADAAIGGRRVVIRLTVRRFFCPFPDCKRRTFAGQAASQAFTLASTSSSPAAATTPSTTTPARCGRRIPSSTAPGHDRHTSPCDNDKTGSWRNGRPRQPPDYQ